MWGLVLAGTLLAALALFVYFYLKRGHKYGGTPEPPEPVLQVRHTNMDGRYVEVSERPPQSAPLVDVRFDGGGAEPVKVTRAGLADLFRQRGLPLPPHLR